MTTGTYRDMFPSNPNMTCCGWGNLTTAEPDTKPYIPFWSTEVIVEVVTVMVVMVATVIGNAVLIYMLAYKKSRRVKRVNVFIINLAIADLAVACITMTTEILFAAFREWVLGGFLCKLTVYLQVVALGSTTFLLTGMSIDRYQVLVKPLRSLANRPKISSKVAIAWIMAFVFAIPQCIIFGQEESLDEDKGVLIKKCRSGGYSAEWQRKLYFTFMTFYILVLPSATMLYCYTSIVRVIFNRGHKNQRHHRAANVYLPRMSVKRNAMSSSRRRVVVMTLSVILAFIVCLTPYFIISLIRIYSGYSLALIDELSISKIIFMLHSALNPILYGVFTLRKEHISRALSSSSCNTTNEPADGTEVHHLTKKEPTCLKLRRGLLLLKRGSGGETSVIIASHSAKEETNLVLNDRQYRKSVAFRPLPVYSRAQSKTLTGNGNTGIPFSSDAGQTNIIHGYEFNTTCQSHIHQSRQTHCSCFDEAGEQTTNHAHSLQSNCLVSVHLPTTPDSGTDVSEV